MSGALATSLSAAITTGVATTFQVAAMPGTWPTSFPFVVLLDWGLTTQEAVLVSAVSGTGPFTLTCARGYDGTTAQAHLINAGVVHGVTEADFLASLQEFYLDQYPGSDDAKFALALAAVIAAGGGTIQLGPRAHAFASQWATALTGSPYYLRIRGAGGGPGGQGDSAPVGATTCNMTYSGGGAAKMDFHHAGTIAVEDISFTDTSGDAVPFFQCTNTSPKLRRLGFTGSKTLTACNQDAILLGGTNPAHLHTDNDDAPFQGYQGVLEDITFYGIRTGAWARTFANSVSMRDLSFDGSCGAPSLFAVTDGAMTAASAVLTCATSAPFTSGMVGQVILVQGAGQANRNSWLIAVISTFTSATQVTLSCAASTTVTAANVSAPVASAIQLGMSGTPLGVEGCVIDDCCIEVSNYAIGVLLNQSTGNAITATALWDGGTGSVVGVGAVGASIGNYVHLTECGITAGGATFLTDKLGNFFGTDVVIAPNGPNPYVQIPGLQLNGSEPLSLFGLGGTAGGAALALGPAGGPADTWLYRDGAGNLTGGLGASGTPLYKFLTTATGADIGQDANFASIGPLSTGDIWYAVGGTATNISINMRAKGSGVIKAQTKMTSGYTGTPTIAANTAAGTGATASVSGNDQRGTITVTTGTGPTTGDLATITFTTSGGTWPSAPFVVVSGDSSAAAALMPGTSNRSTTVFHLQCGSAPAASTAYTFNYLAMA